MNIVYRAFRKAYYLTLGKIPQVDRFFRYRDPHHYWRTRGGETYFDEQEAVQDRTERSLFIADQVKKLSFGSLLEVGCGYSKQLKNLHQPGIFFAGCDFSRPQLLKGREYFPVLAGRVAEADAEFLPFKDKSFDVVMSSAVILHNKYPKAKKIIAEMIRVSKKYLIHNEDTDITFSRYGYDLTKTYRAMNFKIVMSQEIPCSQNPAQTQFTVAEIPRAGLRFSPDEIPLQYHQESR